MKAKYIISGVAVIVFAGLVFVAYKALGTMDQIVKVAIESYGSDIVGARIKLDKVSINLGEGSAAINGLHVANPEGFRTEYAIQLDEARVILDIDSITSDTVIIKEVLIQTPAIIYEMASAGSNIDTLANNAQSYTGSEEKSGDDSNSVKLIIEDFYINDGQVNVSHSILKGKSLSLAMPDIHLQDIGKKENGASAAQVAEEIMESIKSGAGTALASSSIGKTIGGGADMVKKGAANVMDKAKGAGNKLKGLFKSE